VAKRIKRLTSPGQTEPFAHCSLLRVDGQSTDVETAMHVCTYLGKSAIQVLLRDLTESASFNAQLVQQAQHDPLTELANRRQFRDRLDGALARAKRSKQLVGVLCMGLDRFRGVNTSFGQQGGDLVLMQVAERLKDIVRKSDTVARLGNDEFGVILEGLQDKDGATIAALRNLCKLSELPYLVDGKELAMTVSIGIAVYPFDASDADSLLRKSAVAMQYAKQHGRNQFQFYSADLDALDRSQEQRREATGVRMSNLTPRESDVLDLLIAGKASKMIGYLLGISCRTVDVHRGRVMEKMTADSLAELVHMVAEAQA
jgi:diguanylate cyclase (GGDEF)-like protein